MRRFAPAPRRVPFARLLFGITIAVSLALTTISAQIPGRNVNMVAGNAWPNGDPYLQRQNEPSIGASTRNPLHLLAGANDYRTVDLPGLTDDEIGDAWLGLFKSYDGGQRWTSSLLPGYPQDSSASGMASPIKGYGAGADPVVRAGTNGLMYYAGLAFDRANPATPDVPGKSAIFVARFIDNNNKEAGDPFEYLGTRALQTDPGGATGNFLDKPWMVVDIPRDATRCTIVTAGEKGPITQSVPAGPVYVAYTLRSTDNKGARYDVMFTRSADCGNTWTAPIKLNDNNERANQGAALAVDPRNGNVYIAWRQFDVSANNTGTDALMTVKFTRASGQIEKPGFARKFAKPKKGKGKGLDLEHFYKRGGVNKALEAAELSPLDQSTSAAQIRFRTNAYPSMVVDESGRVYLAFAERGYDPLNPDPVLGSARVLIATSLDGRSWTTAKPVSSGEPNQRGHQLMPSITYAGGKLMLVYYDVRESRAQAFTRYIDDRTAFEPGVGTGLRHTIDLRSSMASPGADPAFNQSVAVSEYIEGPRVPGGPSTPWQVNPPNLPMFQKGTAPFIGDYVDITAAPNFIVDAAGRWTYNTAASSTPPIFHAVWTDNRDVRVPLHDINQDGNPWNDYVPPGAPGGVPSIFDPTKVVPMCIPGNAGSRNQNVYTARITGGLLVGSPGNTKRLGYRIDENGAPQQELMQRSFVVFAQNTSDELKRFRFTITNQPVGGRASFDQFSAAPLTMIDADIPYRSTASRTVYATSTDPHAVININVAELVLSGSVWVPKPGGLASNIILNPDIDNPDIDNPDIDNPDIDNPDIDNVEVFNPDIDNPDIDNPDIDNPDIDNPDIDNPDIDNVEVANPDIDNPDIDNPDIDNPDIDNPDIDNPDIDNPDIDNSSLMTDVSWSITNTGNTTASYNVNLFFAQTTFDADIKTQLILYRTYKTPVVVNCELKSETRNMLVANVPNPQLIKGSTGDVTNPNDPAATNATIYLAPGESAKITLRVFDPSPDPGTVVTVTNPDGSTAKIPAQFVPNEDVTPVVQQQSVNTEDVDEGVTEPPVVVQFPAPQTVPDTVSTSQVTPVTVNVLANDSTAFGSTKIISLHPAGMATHSGGGPGDIAYQPASGLLYTQRGAIDPVTSTLVGRFGSPTAPGGVVAQYPNPLTGINYQRSTNASSTIVTALDARPGSTTFHKYLPMEPVSPSTDVVLALALDPVHHRLYAAHAPNVGTATTPTTVSVYGINPADTATFHKVIATVALPLGLRPQAMAVNTRTRRVYVTTGGANGGVYVFDGAAVAPAAAKVPGTFSGWSVAVNEASNLVYVASSFGPANLFGLHVIDGASNALTTINTPEPMRFGSPEERLAVHYASGKVLMRLENKVVIFDTQRGSPTRNTVVGEIPVGSDNNQADIAIDQQLGLAVTVGQFDFKAHVIDIADNSVAAEVLLNAGPLDVAIDPVSHRAFISISLTSVQVLDLANAAMGAIIPTFIESGGTVVNPVTNKAYSGMFTTGGNIGIFSGSGFNGYVPGVNPGGRYLFADRHVASNRYFMVVGGNPAGTSYNPGSVVVIDGATDQIETVVTTPPNPFGIGIDQSTNKVYVATNGGNGIQGGVRIFNALTPGAGAIDASFAGGLGVSPGNFPLNNANSLVAFGRSVIVNPNTGNVYAMVMGGSPVSLAMLNTSNVLQPLDGKAGTPLFDAQQAAGENWGRVTLVRVNATRNRIYVGLADASGVNRLVVLDGTTNLMIGAPWLYGQHSNRHTPSWLVVDEARDRLYITNYAAHTMTMVDAGNMNVVATVPVREGPSAQAFNATAHRLYVSSIDAKIIQSIDVSSDNPRVVSEVRMPLVAYFMYVDEVESRIYTSGGDSSDESGVMVITDILGRLGTAVSVESVGSAQNGTVVLNDDYSVTYTPNPGFAGVDQFNYEIEAPTGTAIGTVTVTVVPSNPAAVAFGDAYATGVGQQLSVAAPGPLANDATPGSTITTMVVDDTTDHGVLTPQADGSFTYMPGAAFTGTDTFTYRAMTDNLGASNPVTVTIAIAAPASLVVTNTADSGAGSLRQALLNAQLETNATIRFNIPNAGPHTITPQSPLPAITRPTTIDGYSQPGAAPNTAAVGTNAQIAIQVNGASAGSGTTGLTINGGGTTVRGLSIYGFNGIGLLLDLVGGNVIEGNFIGTNAAGASGIGNGAGGITVQSGGNMIGGNTLGARNLISGNAGQAGVRVQARHQNGVVQNDGSGTVIKGNLIGTNRSGLGALSNGLGVAVSVSNVTIGGTTPAERNVIGGNTNTGINAFASTFDADGNGPMPAVLVSEPSFLTVRGNYVGIRADGSGQLGNFSSGVSVSGASSTIADNVISGNFGPGLSIGASTDTTAASPTFGTIWSQANNTVVTGNLIGLDPAGTTAIGNITAVQISVEDVVVGGTTPALRNVIAGNSSTGISIGNIFANNAAGTPVRLTAGDDAIIQGNYVGLNAAGTVKIGNNGPAIASSARGTIIGGPNPGEGNVIVAGASSAINLQRHVSGTTVINAAGFGVIEGNIVGLNAAGTAAMNGGNSGVAVFIATAGNQIANNVISGNGVVGTTQTNGLTLFSSFAANNVVRGNLIGTNENGDPFLGNSARGLVIQGGVNNTIGGTTLADRNIVVSNGNFGISFDGTTGTTSGNVVQGNYVGVAADGVTVLPNNGVGINLYANSGSFISNNTIGGSEPGARNVIAGNTGDGFSLGGGTDGNTNNNTIAGNYIGVGADGVTLRPNGANGVFINNAVDNFIGGTTAADGNLIAGNAQAGVFINAQGVRNRLLSNRIHSNGGMEIDLSPGGVNPNDTGDGDTGANNRQNYPVLANATNTGATTTVDVDMSSFVPGPGYTVQFFATTACEASGNGGGRRLVGSMQLFQPGANNVSLTELVPDVEFITATATDSNGNTSEFSACLPAGAPATVVTNTNDSGAGSLRAAMAAANGAPGAQTITFNIPGASAGSPAVITVASALPAITDAVDIDGTSQPGYDGRPVIEVRSPSSTMGLTGFFLNANNITIRGLSIQTFSQGILAFQTFSGHTIRQNWIGTDRDDATGRGNGTGVQWRASSSSIRDNVISGNSGDGVSVLLGAANNHFLNNKIGVTTDGTASLPNAGSGITLFDGPQNNTIDTNIIAGNTLWGVELQNNGASAAVSGTVLRSNFVGVGSNGSDIGNLGGGVRIDRAPNTRVGIPGIAPNVISGNGGNLPGQIGVGIQVLGNVVPVPMIQGNYIGLDPTGSLARSNNNKGISLDGPALVGGTNVQDRNYISGNGAGDPAGAGIIVSPGADGSNIVNNVIGLNVGNVAMGNSYAGITVRTSGAITIGGSAAGANVIAGNGSYGISIVRVAPTDAPANVLMTYNFIGTDASATLQRPNGLAGINVADGTGHRIGGNSGAGNLIYYNGIAGGIRVTGANTQVRIQENSIANNGGPGIDLGGDGVTANDGPTDSDAGPNALQNFVTMVSAVTSGSQNTNVVFDTNVLNPGNQFTVEVFASNTCETSGFGEGLAFAGSNLVTGGSGNVNFALGLSVAPGQFITATATDAAGHTSEFSNCVQVVNPPGNVTAVYPGAFTRGQMITIDGSGFSAIGASDVVVRQGVNDYPASYLFTNSATRIVARTHTGPTDGAAAIIIKSNGGSESASFPVTITSAPAAPIFRYLFGGSCGSYGYGGTAENPSSIWASYAGASIVAVADGIDTSGAQFVFTPTNVAGPPIVVPATATCAGPVGRVAATVQVPSSTAPGTIYSVTLRMQIGFQTSGDSNAFTLTVEGPGASAGAAGSGSGSPWSGWLQVGEAMWALRGQYSAASGNIMQALGFGGALKYPMDHSGERQFAGATAGGDTAFDATCSAGNVATGLTGTVSFGGTSLTSIGVLCKSPQNLAGGVAQTVGPFGPGGGTPFTISCPAGTKIYQIDGVIGTAINRIEAFCR